MAVSQFTAAHIRFHLRDAIVHTFFWASVDEQTWDSCRIFFSVLSLGYHMNIDHATKCMELQA